MPNLPCKIVRVINAANMADSKTSRTRPPEGFIALTLAIRLLTYFFTKLFLKLLYTLCSICQTQIYV